MVVVVVAGTGLSESVVFAQCWSDELAELS
jgi:hypothetical protein